MNKELDTLMKNRPNILGNSIGILLIRILAWVGAILCFAAGIYFLTLSTTNDSDKSFFEGLYYKDSNPIFAERVKAIKVKKTQAKESLKKSEELFSSLLQRAFKGEVL
jgi:hypothetical protein